MKKEKLIKLTHRLYNLTGLFPNKEPLRYKIRGVANDILADLILLISDFSNPNLKRKKKIKNRLLESIEILLNLLDVARPQDWVSPDDILELRKEYSKIKEAVALIASSKTKSKSRSKSKKGIKKDVGDTLSGRQKKILKLLKQNGKSQISDFKKAFSKVSRRTIIRDLNNLSKKGLVKKEGSGPAVFYRFKK